MSEFSSLLELVDYMCKENEKLESERKALDEKITSINSVINTLDKFLYNKIISDYYLIGKYYVENHIDFGFNEMPSNFTINIETDNGKVLMIKCHKEMLMEKSMVFEKILFTDYITIDKTNIIFNRSILIDWLYYIYCKKDICVNHTDYKFLFNNLILIGAVDLINIVKSEIKKLITEELSESIIIKSRQLLTAIKDLNINIC